MHPWIADRLGKEHLGLLHEQAERQRLARSVQGRRPSWLVRGFEAMIAGRLARPTMPGGRGATAQGSTARELIAGRPNSNQA